MNRNTILIVAALVAIAAASTIVFLTQGPKEETTNADDISVAEAPEAVGETPTADEANGAADVRPAAFDPADLSDVALLPTPQDPTAEDIAVESDAPVDLAYGAYQRGLYLEAFAHAVILAEEGNVPAQTLLGILYTEGLGVPQDLEEAAGWFELAANAGDANAQFALGAAYYDGAGVPVDHARAIDLFEQAAEQGIPEALYNAGVAYIDGEVREPDETRAVAYISEAAGLDFPDAQYALALMYIYGQGVIRSDEIANRWLARAAEAGQIDAQIEYANRLFEGIGAEPDEAAAAVWFRQAARAGNPVGHARYGLLLANGAGVEPDPIEAGMHYLLARAAGLDDTMLGTFFDSLDEEDKQAAIEAAEQSQAMLFSGG